VIRAVLTAATTRQPEASRTETQTQQQERAYGWELISPEERSAYQTNMRNMKTEHERQRLREEHHKKMQEGAKALGKTLPEEPGTGQGMGQGMGKGQEMGRGQQSPANPPSGPKGKSQGNT